MTQTVFSPGTMISREEIEATKEWFKGMTDTMMSLVREQRLLVEAQAESLRMLNESAISFTVAVAKFSDATTKVSKAMLINRW